MLKRYCIQEKKKKKKNEIDKRKQTISGLIEKELRDSNQVKTNINTGPNHITPPLNLESLLPQKFKFWPSRALINFFKDLSKLVEEFVLLNNEYM